jgi:hypothetical protein
MKLDVTFNEEYGLREFEVLIGMLGSKTGNNRSIKKIT